MQPFNKLALLALFVLAASCGPGSSQVVGPVNSGSSGTGCIPSGGSSGNILLTDGAGACLVDSSAALLNGVLSLGSSGTVGSVVMGNATTGTLKLHAATGALGTSDVTFPAGTYIVAPTANPTFTGSLTATGLITNADLVNPSTSVNSQTCTLGSTCTITVAISTGVTGLGTGVGTALAIVHDTTGGICTVGGGGCTGSGNVTGPGSSVSGNYASFNGTGGLTIQDSGQNSTSFAPPGLGAVVTGSQTPSAADWAACKFIVLNGNTLDVKTVVSTTLQANGGCLQVLAEGTSDTITVTSPDTIKYGSTTSGAGGTQPLTQGGLYAVATDGAGHLYSTLVGAGSSGITNGTTPYTSPAATTSIPFVAAGVMQTSAALTSDTSGNVNVASLVSAGQFSTAQDVTFGSGFSHIYSGPAGSGFGCAQTPAAGDWKFGDTNCNVTWEVSPVGEQFTGTIPAVTGTGSPTITAGSTDARGEIISGASATSLVLHSADAAVTTAPFCVFFPEQAETTVPFAVPSVAASHWLMSLTLTAGSSQKFMYFCSRNGP